MFILLIALLVLFCLLPIITPIAFYFYSLRKGAKKEPLLRQCDCCKQISHSTMCLPFTGAKRFCPMCANKIVAG